MTHASIGEFKAHYSVVSDAYIVWVGKGDVSNARSYQSLF